MLEDLPPELLHEIVILASPLILLSYDHKSPPTSHYIEPSPPTIVGNIARTCSVLNAKVEYTKNALLYASIFERTFDFDAARRRLGNEWANPHGLAWEGKRRWIMIKRMKEAVASWDREGCNSLSWVDSYGEEDLLSDLWTIYFMILENDGRNAILLVERGGLGSYVEMLCGLFFGRRLVRRVGWPKETQERALLAWILCALDPMPSDFHDQDMYHRTKLSMRAFAFGSFKAVIPWSQYSLGTLPPTYFNHPSRLNPSHYKHQPLPTATEPYPLSSSSSSSRYTTWISPLKPPIYKFSADPLIPVPLYARTVWIYQPSLAVAALLWYFRGVSEAGTPSSDTDRDTESDREEYQQASASPPVSGTNAQPSIPSTSNSDSSPLSPPSSSSSYFSPIQAQTRGWTTPILFNIPRAGPTTLSQVTTNKRWRNELYLRGFNAPSRQLETEWVRRLEGPMRFNGPNPNPITGFVPGSLEGTWEGGFAYLDFPDYAQFLTGEREADSEFYSQSAEKMYGMNRQVWKLKEYELPINPYQTSPTSPNALNSSSAIMAASATLTLGGNGYSYPYPPTSAMSSSAGATAGSVSTSASSSSSSSFYEPLTEGKWRDGWLPPAEALQWRFPDDCGDELEIVETVAVMKQGQGDRRTTMESSNQGSVSSSSKGGDDEDSIGGWEREKAGFSGRIRGRLNARQGRGTEPRPSELGVAAAVETSESITPVGLKISRTVEGAASPREIPMRTGTMSPRSPEFDTTVMPASAGFGGRRRDSGTDEYSFEDGRWHGPSRTGTGNEVDANTVASALNEDPRVVEKVSRYVRWDPHVAWARQAIWGNTSDGSAGHSGKIRGSHAHAPNAGSKNKGGEWMVGRVRRHIRDILIFGESHSSWGEATIRGRVRSHDGLITLVKNYPQRATWIYTGYMVGGESFVGRWRDADSPDEVNGYEGPFAMKRRPKMA